MGILSDYRTEKVAEIISELRPKNIENIIVVGCGAGMEAAILAQRLEADVVGIDIEDNFDSEAINFASLEVGNARSLRFPDSSFDFVYSYHALEHIDNPLIALKEMKRVLKDGGGYWIGTPNRSGLIRYIVSNNSTIGQKLRRNISDWKAKLTGKFKNELGAHAGFSPPELEFLLRNVFRDNNNVSDIYYMKIYNRKKLLISLLKNSYLSSVVYPSVYFMGSA